MLKWSRRQGRGEFQVSSFQQKIEDEDENEDEDEEHFECGCQNGVLEGWRDGAME